MIEGELSVRKLIVLCLAVFVGIVGIGMLIGFGVTERTEDTGVHEQLAQLWRLGTIAASGPVKLVIKLGGEVKYNGNKADFTKKMHEISGWLEFPRANIREEHGKMVYRTERSMEGYRLYLTGSQRDAGHFFYTLQLEGISAKSSEQREAFYTIMANNQHTLVQTLASRGIPYQWNATVQGAVQTGISNLNAQQTVHKLAGQFNSFISMTEVERYSDTATYSASYHAPSLGTGVQSGGHTIQLQMAVHQDKKQGNSQISIGMPLITIEY